jgi:hypothetical protein
MWEYNYIYLTNYKRGWQLSVLSLLPRLPWSHSIANNIWATALNPLPRLPWSHSTTWRTSLPWFPRRQCHSIDLKTFRTLCLGRHGVIAILYYSPFNKDCIWDIHVHTQGGGRKSSDTNQGMVTQREGNTPTGHLGGKWSMYLHVFITGVNVCVPPQQEERPMGLRVACMTHAHREVLWIVCISTSLPRV